jgi:hypothetical protein
LGGPSKDKRKKEKGGKTATTAGKKAKTSGKQHWGDGKTANVARIVSIFSVTECEC